MTENQPEPEPRCEAEASRAADERSEPRITNTQKEKDPRKVAAGKKLGLISKMAKKQKASAREDAAKPRRQTEAERALPEDEDEDDTQNLKNNNAFFYVGFSEALAMLAAVVVVGCLGVIYFTKQPASPHGPEPKEVPAGPVASVGPKFQQTSLTHRGSNLISLDD